jgi:hypothetical protein
MLRHRVYEIINLDDEEEEVHDNEDDDEHDGDVVRELHSYSGFNLPSLHGSNIFASSGTNEEPTTVSSEDSQVICDVQ